MASDLSGGMESLPHLEEGKYVVELVEGTRGAPKYGRTDLVLKLRISQGKHKGGVLLAYYQVQWIDHKRFTSGPKSNYFRDYQSCIGKVEGLSSFTTSDFKSGKYVARVQSVKKDSDREDLAHINWYSRVGRLLKSHGEF